ncbi:Fic family protein [Shouchella shacheensis]|uniref:Fic family protein n=1 Tax=Shouchella shacheensis TaxID=1649580 RepID=UPI0007402E7E|nr:Fic family protein [Shouchella shacheensis]
MLPLPKEYADDLLVRLAHHSSAIEGNTITLAETVSIILHNTITGDHSFDLREVYEIKNHQQAFDFVLSELTKGEPLSVYTIQEIHALLTDRLQYDKGQFKAADNAIVGADFVTASAKETPLLIRQWVDNLNFRLQAAKDGQEKIGIISEAHIVFERIHPFSDGNGRAGRMVMNYSLLQNHLPPLVINNKERARYIAFLAEEDQEGFSQFVEKAIEEEKERRTQFQNAEDQRIKEQSRD